MHLSFIAYHEILVLPFLNAIYMMKMENATSRACPLTLVFPNLRQCKKYESKRILWEYNHVLMIETIWAWSPSIGGEI